MTTKYRWYGALMAISLVILVGSTASCTSATVAKETACEESAYPSINNSFAANLQATDDGQAVSLYSTASGTANANKPGSNINSKLIGCDPVSGRNQEINFTWEQPCLATGYDLEIAKDENFTIKVLDVMGDFDVGTGYVPEVPMSPAAYYPAGADQGPFVAAGSQLAVLSPLECGHTYYWRVQVRSDAWGGQVRSPWSEVGSFTIKAGLPVTTPYYGPQLLAPNNGCLGCPVKPVSFSWSPLMETTKYKFILYTDAALTQVIKEVEVSGGQTAYEYDGTLDYSTNYFWQVMALEPAPSAPSATFSFQTEAPPPPPPEPPEPPPIPLWVWTIIAIGVILMIVTLVLVFRTRRV